MPHTVPPADYQARLTELSELYGACRVAFEGLAADTGWHAALDSLGDADLRELLGRDPAAPESVPDVLPSLTDWYLHGASSYLGSLSVLFANGEVLVAPAPLIRGVLELCARIVWLLGDLRHESLERRLARGWLEALLDAEEAQKTSGRLLGADSNEKIRRRQRFRNLKRDAKQLFPAPHHTSDGRPVLGGQTLPCPHACVTAMLSAPTFGLDAAVAGGINDFYSNRSHPTPYQLSSIWTMSTTGDVQEPVLLRTIFSHEQDARIAVLSFYTALSYTMLYHGWPGDRQHALTTVIDRILPNALAPAPRS